ncbi:MAG: TIGR01777 family oxidoreductase [Trueperaceae bacterium]
MAADRVVIAGGTGLLGGALVAVLSDVRPEYELIVLSRGGPDGAATSDDAGVLPAGAGGPRLVRWRPDAAAAGDEAELLRLATVVNGARAVVNMAGASIGAGRLGPDHVARVRASRVDGTTTLVEAARRASTAPEVFLQGSAIGIYGDRGDEVLTESAALTEEGVLAESSRAWEAAAAPAAERSRLVIGRTALALHPDAPSWQRMILPVRWFVGGPLGTGRQWLSWITAEDHARALLHLIDQDEGSGAVNLAAPEPLRQADLVRAVARRLRRPAFFPVPAPLLRLVLGRLADATVLPSARVVPERLLAGGFRFRHPTFDVALDRLLPPRST